MNKFPVTDSIIGRSAEHGQLESDLSLDNPSDDNSGLPTANTV